MPLKVLAQVRQLLLSLKCLCYLLYFLRLVLRVRETTVFRRAASFHSDGLDYRFTQTLLAFILRGHSLVQRVPVEEITHLYLLNRHLLATTQVITIDHVNLTPVTRLLWTSHPLSRVGLVLWLWLWSVILHHRQVSILGWRGGISAQSVILP